MVVETTRAIKKDRRSFLASIVPRLPSSEVPYLISSDVKWLKVLKSDKRAIFTAASKAQEAATYLESLAGLAQECAS